MAVKKKTLMTAQQDPEPVRKESDFSADEEAYDEAEEKKASAYFGIDYFAEMPALKEILDEYRPLSRKDEQDLLLRKENSKAMDKLVYHNLRLVADIVDRYQYFSDYDFLDLFQIGVMGLMQAIKNYNPKYETKLSTYATEVIECAVWSEIEKNNPIHVSKGMLKKIRQVTECEKRLTAKLGDAPSAEEVAEDLGISLKELEKRKRIRIMIAPLSLDVDLNEDGTVTLADLIEDLDQDLDRNLLLEEVQEAVHNELDALENDRQKEVLLRHYGFGKSQAKIAKEQGVSKERIRQIVEAAKKKLMAREQKKQNLKAFL